jgi:DNA-binding CsgD family transcriptional regulator
MLSLGERMEHRVVRRSAASESLEAVDAALEQELEREVEDWVPLLSPREQEIARLVAVGYPNKTIAGILEISPWTVATHVRRIFCKLNVHCRPHMVAELARCGFRFERRRPPGVRARLRP